MKLIFNGIYLFAFGGNGVFIDLELYGEDGAVCLKNIFISLCFLLIMYYDVLSQVWNLFQNSLRLLIKTVSNYSKMLPDAYFNIYCNY